MYLIDIRFPSLQPTRSNKRSGGDEISKRLDRLLISENSIESMDRYKTWVEYESISYHSPIFLKIDPTGRRDFYPFKFNHLWLKEKSLNTW